MRIIFSFDPAGLGAYTIMLTDFCIQISVLSCGLFSVTICIHKDIAPLVRLYKARRSIMNELQYKTTHQHQGGCLGQRERPKYGDSKNVR